MVFVGAVECGRQLAKLEGGRGAVGRPDCGDDGAGRRRAPGGLGIWILGGGADWRLPRADQIGVAFAGSQKTLMVGLAIAIEFGGLAVLPMVAYHVEQLLIDTVLADRLRQMRADGSPGLALRGLPRRGAGDRPLSTHTGADKL